MNNSGIKVSLALILIIGGIISAAMTIKVLVANSDGTLSGMFLSGGMGLTLELGKVAFFGAAAFFIFYMRQHMTGVLLILCTIPMYGISLAGTVWQVQSGLAAVETEAAQTSDLRELLTRQADALANSVNTKSAAASAAAESAADASRKLPGLERKISGIQAEYAPYVTFAGGACIAKSAPGGGTYKTKAAEACDKLTPLYNDRAALQQQIGATGSNSVDADIAGMTAAVAQIAAIDSGEVGGFSYQDKALTSMANMFDTDKDAVKGVISWVSSIGLEVCLAVATFCLVMIEFTEKKQQLGVESMQQPQPQRPAVSFGFAPPAPAYSASAHDREPPSAMGFLAPVGGIRPTEYSVFPNRNTETTPEYSGFPNGNGGTQAPAPVSENPAKGTGRKKTGKANDECIIAYIRQIYFLKPETLVSDAIRSVRKAGYSGANEKFISMIHTVKSEMGI